MITKLPDRPEHIGIIVPDIVKACQELRNLYGELPGLDFSYVFKPNTVWTNGVKNEEKVELQLCMVQFAPNLKFELIQPLTRGEYEHRMSLLSTRRGGIHHVAYYTKNHYEDYRQLLLDRGGHIVFESETDDARGYRRCCYVKCPDSRLLIEIAEPPKAFEGQATSGGMDTAVD